jgi:molecular chaperone HtpG
VKVVTRHYKSKNKYLIELEKGNEWTSLTETEDVVFDGTEVILNYSNFMEVFENKSEKVQEFLNLFFLTDGIEFELVDKFEKKILRINNPIKPTTIPDKGLVKIDLQDYLKEIEGYALIKNRNSFIKKFEDLSFVGELYRYSHQDGLVKVEDLGVLELDDYVNEKEIQYLSIPLIESPLEDDYLSGMKFTGDDLSEVLGKLDRELSWISVIVTKELQDSLPSQTIWKGDRIFENLSFEDLEDIGHCATCSTKTFVNKITLFEGRKNDLYLPFDDADRDSGLYYWRLPAKRKELFMRSVLIKDFRFNIPISASIFEISTIVANINSRNFIPDISRNNVDAKAKENINDIIGKAIHVGASNVLKLGTDEKNTLESFIGTFYAKKTEYEK